MHGSWNNSYLKIKGITGKASAKRRGFFMTSVIGKVPY